MPSINILLIKHKSPLKYFGHEYNNTSLDDVIKLWLLISELNTCLTITSRLYYHYTNQEYGGYDGNRTHVFLRDKEMGLNHCPTQPNLNFVCEISNSLIFSTLVQNRTGTAGLEDSCTIHCTIRVF